jgi:hypothetical protein
MATSSVLAVRSEILICNGFVRGIEGSNPDDSMCEKILFLNVVCVM